MCVLTVWRWLTLSNLDKSVVIIKWMIKYDPWKTSSICGVPGIWELFSNTQYTNLLLPFLMSDLCTDFRGHGWTVIRPNLYLFWNSKECILGWRIHLVAAYSHFFFNHSFMQHPWKVIHLPTEGARTPARKHYIAHWTHIGSTVS